VQAVSQVPYRIGTTTILGIIEGRRHRLLLMSERAATPEMPRCVVCGRRGTMVNRFVCRTDGGSLVM
jgi:hypothetical protein